MIGRLVNSGQTLSFISVPITQTNDFGICIRVARYNAAEVVGHTKSSFSVTLSTLGGLATYYRVAGSIVHTDLDTRIVITRKVQIPVSLPVGPEIEVIMIPIWPFILA